MKLFFVTNEDVYLKYKEDILPLNARLFTTPYFYTLNTYKVPIDLSGSLNFLSYVKTVEIITSSTLLDYVNILLILSFLKDNKYENDVVISYYILNGNSSQKIFAKIKVDLKELENLQDTISSLKEKKMIAKYDSKIMGSINFVNFYNMLNDSDRFMLSLQEVIDDFEEDADAIASYLEKKYSNMKLSKKYYLQLLEKYL